MLTDQQCEQIAGKIRKLEDQNLFLEEKIQNNLDQKGLFSLLLKSNQSEGIIIKGSGRIAKLVSQDRRFEIFQEGIVTIRGKLIEDSDSDEWIIEEKRIDIPGDFSSFWNSLKMSSLNKLLNDGKWVRDEGGVQRTTITFPVMRIRPSGIEIPIKKSDRDERLSNKFRDLSKKISSIGTYDYNHNNC